LTVDDIFRAKEARRERLARLPFEEKIAIVKRLQTVPAALNDERVIFDWFLRICPDFASEPIKEWDIVNEWYAKRGLVAPPHPFDKRPDIIAITQSGKRIGVELKSWVNRERIAEARKQERIQENILKAIGQQPRNETQHIGFVWLSAKEVRFDWQDAAQFREEMFNLIKEADSTWSQKPKWLQACSDDANLNGFPMLAKYLNGVRLHPNTRTRFDIRWIRFPSPGGAYSPNEMLETLGIALLAHKNDERYKDLKTKVGLEKVYLLIHYDFKAFAYNTPFDAPNFGFREAAQFASSALNGDGGYFDRIFLFHFCGVTKKLTEFSPQSSRMAPQLLRNNIRSFPIAPPRLYSLSSHPWSSTARRKYKAPHRRPAPAVQR